MGTGESVYDSDCMRLRANGGVELSQMSASRFPVIHSPNWSPLTANSEPEIMKQLVWRAQPQLCTEVQETIQQDREPGKT